MLVGRIGEVMNASRIGKDHSRFTNITLCSLALSSLGGCQGEPAESSVMTATEALSSSPGRLREFIAGQVGGLDKLQVPSDDASIPLPPADPSRPGRYDTTEAKRY